VLTVTSAGAARTTFARCYKPDQGQPQLAAYTTDSLNYGTDSYEDQWFRVPINAVRYTPKPQPENKKGVGGGRKAIDAVYIQYPGDQTWWMLQSPTDYTTPPVQAALPNDQAGYDVKPYKLAALAYFEPSDPTGTYRSLAWQGSTGTIADKSCHASVF
jgi:hypothetical protein